MKRLRTAIIGCGGFANTHAKNLIAEAERFKLVALCDIVEANAQRFAQQHPAARREALTRPGAGGEALRRKPGDC